MRRISVALAVAIPLLATAPACKLASRNRVQSINRMNEGIKLEAKNNTSQAEKALKESIELDPTHAKAHYTLGQIYRKQGKLVDAQKAFTDAIANMDEAPNADYAYQLGVVIAAQGYPAAPRSGDAISGLPADAEDLKVFHAGTALVDGQLRSSGGRVLCVTALGDSARVAQQRAYEGVRDIQLDGAVLRQDIGHRAIKARG